MYVRKTCFQARKETENKTKKISKKEEREKEGEREKSPRFGCPRRHRELQMQNIEKAAATKAHQNHHTHTHTHTHTHKKMLIRTFQRARII